MTEVEQPPQNGIDLSAAEDDDNSKARPADIEQDMREMERRKRVEAIMGSKLFREELERIVDSARDSGTSGILQQLSDIVGLPASRVGSVYKATNCMMPINDIRGVESMGYAKGEKILRCKLAATFRLLDLYGWTQGLGAQITARLKVDQEYFLVNPYGLLYHEITASSLNKVDMQGQIVEQGTTNFGVNKSHFVLHSVVHAARPDIRCAIYIGASTVVAISSLKSGVLPLTKDACVLGEISTHAYTGALLDVEERERLVRNLGPNSKVLLLSNYGALCCGETIEEAFFAACHLVQACETQLKLLPVGIDNLVLIPEESRKTIYEQSRRPPEDLEKKFAAAAQLGEESTAAAAAEDKDAGVPKIGSAPKWRVGGAEFEGLMRMLDNAGYRTGYIYRHPLIKSDPPKPKNDVELPPAVSSLGYLLEEEELFRQGIWKKGDLRKGGDRSRWLNSPNVYQKVEVLETGTPDPKKITKWVAEGSPTHSTPVRIEDPLQFVPAGTNPKEFKRLQQQIKDNRRADKISAGPQSHILEGVTWDEANRIKDATVSQAGDHVVLMGAASKGIIQRGFQHNATVYKAPYAKNPFDNVTDDELNEYKRTVERKKKSIHGEYTDTDFSESEALSSLQTSGAQQTKQTTTTTTAAVSQSEPEDVSEHQVIRIQTQQAPMPSQAEVVLSDATLNFINGERSHTAVNKKPPTGRDIEMMNPQATEIAKELISKLNAIKNCSRHSSNAGSLSPATPPNSDPANHNNNGNNNSNSNKENVYMGNQNVQRNEPLMAEMRTDPLFLKQRDKNIRKTPSTQSLSSSQSTPPPAPPTTPVTATAAVSPASPKRALASATTTASVPIPPPLPPFSYTANNSWFEPIVKSTCCVMRAGGLGSCLGDDSHSFSSPHLSAMSRERSSIHVDTPRPPSLSARSRASTSSCSNRTPAPPLHSLPSFEQAFSHSLRNSHHNHNHNNLYSVCYEHGNRRAATAPANQYYGSQLYESVTHGHSLSGSYEDIEDVYKKSIFCCTPTICENILQAIHQPAENDLILNIPFTLSNGAGTAPPTTASSSTTSANNSPRRGSRFEMPKSSRASTGPKSPYRTVSHFGFNSPNRDPQPDHKHIPKSPIKTPIVKSLKGLGNAVSYEGIFSSPRFVDLCENCFEKVTRLKPELLQMRTRLRNIADFHCAAGACNNHRHHEQHHHETPEMSGSMGVVNLHDGYESNNNEYPITVVSSGGGVPYDYVECMSSEPHESYQPYFSQLETVHEVEEPASSEANRVQRECSRYQSSFIDKIMSMNYSEESTNINFAIPNSNFTLDLDEKSPAHNKSPPAAAKADDDEEKRIEALIDEAKRNISITEIWEFGNWRGSDDTVNDDNASLAAKQPPLTSTQGDGEKSLTDTESSLNLHHSVARENLYELAFGAKHNTSDKSGSDANTTSSSRRRLDFSESDEDAALVVPQQANDNAAHPPADDNAAQESPPDSGVHSGKRLLMDRDERLRRKEEFQELWEDHIAYFTNREQFLLSDTESAIDQQQPQANAPKSHSSSSAEGKKIEILDVEIFDSRTYVFKGRNDKNDEPPAPPDDSDDDQDKPDDDNGKDDKDKDKGNGNGNDSDSDHSTRTYNVVPSLSQGSLVKSNDTLVGEPVDFQQFYTHSNYEQTFQLYSQNQLPCDNVDMDFQKLLSNQCQDERIETDFAQIVNAIKAVHVEPRASTPDLDNDDEPMSIDWDTLKEHSSDEESGNDVNSNGSTLSAVEKKILKKIEKHNLNKSEEIFDKIETTIRNKKTPDQLEVDLLAKAQQLSEGTAQTLKRTSNAAECGRDQNRPATNITPEQMPKRQRLSRSLNPLSPTFESSSSNSDALPSSAQHQVETPKQTQPNEPVRIRSAPELKRRTQPKRNFILENIRKASTPRRQHLGSPQAVFGRNPFGPFTKKSNESVRSLLEGRPETTSSVYSFQSKVRGSPRLWVSMSPNSPSSSASTSSTTLTASSSTNIAQRRRYKKNRKQSTFVVETETDRNCEEATQNEITESNTELLSPSWQKEIVLMNDITSEEALANTRTRVDDQIDELAAAIGEAKPLLESCTQQVQEFGENLTRCTHTVDECIAEQNELAQEFEKFSESVKLSQYADRINCMVNCSLTETDLNNAAPLQ